MIVRGERGEILDSAAVYLKDHRIPIQTHFLRHEAGPKGNLEGFYLKGIQFGDEWVYYNPLAPAALADEEIAVGTCLLRMGAYVASGRAFYPLAEACQNRYLDLLMSESIERGAPVQTKKQPWHDLDLWQS